MNSDVNRHTLVPSSLDDDSVLASGPFAISLYNKGSYGVPEDTGVRLNGFEALHLLELKRIEIHEDDMVMKEKNLVKHFSEKIPNFMLRYLVYKDLRNRGYIVNIGMGSSFFFRLYARDTKPKLGGAKYYVTPLREGGSILLKELEDLVEIASQSKKTLLFGMVDAVGDVSYLQLTKLIPEDISSNKPFAQLEGWSWDDGWEDYISRE
ncbi:MAG: tRNA-intron lyase [Candidatus Kariarchaeaceae archaeon]|jgi:tRNA-intron endonuclease